MDDNDNEVQEQIFSDCTIKDAIVACAREEVRSLLRQIVASPCNIKTSTNRSYQYAVEAKPRERSSTAYQNCQSRKTKLQTRARNNNSCNQRSSAVSGFIDSVYDSKFGQRRQKTRHAKAKLSSIEGKNFTPDHLLKREKPGRISYSSSNFIKRSDTLLRDDEKITESHICNTNCKEVFQVQDNNLMYLNDYFLKDNKDENIHVLPNSQKKRSFQRKKADSQKDKCLSYSSDPRPKSAIENRRPTTARERRTWSSRPSTAHIVRAKAKDFSKLLLDPIDKLNCPINVASNLMNGSEWENELARHIVSVFNNKTISDVRGNNVVKTNEVVLKSSQEVDENVYSQCKSGFNIKTSFRNNIEAYKDSKKLMDGLKPRMIWVVGMTDAFTDWRFMNESSSMKVESILNLETLKKTGKYMEYIETVKGMLCSMQVQSYTYTIPPLHGLSTWKQLVLATIHFSTQLIQQQSFAPAIELLHKAKDLMVFFDIDEAVDDVNELNAIMKETLAYYYSRRDKPSAALKYIIEALNIQKKRHDRVGTLQCNLHRAYILYQLRRFNEATATLKQIVQGINNGSLDKVMHPEETLRNSNQMEQKAVLLIAVVHHNMCCLQLIKGRIGDACLSSQSCRRLSRLCFNLSSRYLSRFEETHMKAMNELFNIVCPKQTSKEAAVFQTLFAQLLDPTD